MSYFFARAKERAAEPHGGLDDRRGQEGRGGHRRAPLPPRRAQAADARGRADHARRRGRGVRPLARRRATSRRSGRWSARIIDERIDDGQFDECDLTLRDVEQIREAFVGQLLGMYHTRIAYPQNKVVELESRRRGRGRRWRRRRRRRLTAGHARRPRDRGAIYVRPWRIDLDRPARACSRPG